MQKYLEAEDHVGVMWEFFLCDADDPHLHGESGYTDFENNKSYICGSGHPKRVLTLCLHELIHVVLSEPGAGPILTKVLHCKPDDLVSREEDVVAYLAPRLFALLDRNGFLQMPKVPNDDTNK